MDTTSSDQLVTERRVIAAFEARLKETMESVISIENVLRDGTAEDEEASSDTLTTKREEQMDDVEQHDMIAANAKDRLLALSSLNTMQTFDTVEVGALVNLNKVNVLVCVALEPLDVDGTMYSGVSLQAPLTHALIGKKVGETVVVNETSFTIKSII